MLWRSETPGDTIFVSLSQAVIIRRGAEGQGIVPWDDVEGIALDVPTTRFRLPGFFGTVLLGALTAAMLSDPGIEPDDGAVTLTVDGGEHDAAAEPPSRRWLLAADGGWRHID